MKSFLLPLFVILFFNFPLCAQNVWSTEAILPSEDYDNIHVQKLDSDSLGTAFLIWVKDSVALHHHAFHTESVYILEGEGEMILDDERIKVKAGDFVFIPSGILHSLYVSSAIPMKAISMQAPKFLGKDRIFAGQLRKK